jgi:hypothetical protein|nr:hypothetical protein [Candidatus Krumholzibacteria bacterium]
MHDGCTGPTGDGQMVVNKVRLMGFHRQPLPLTLEIPCRNCGKTFAMTHFETACPECDMVHGVTPCSAGNPDAVKAAGIGY